MRPASASSANVKEGLEKMTGEFARDVESLEVTRNEDRASIRELEIGVLKGPLIGLGQVDRQWVLTSFFFSAKTRKEEIVRFDKARSDVEFGRMLRARILSPEQTELQAQLRRDIRVGRVNWRLYTCLRVSQAIQDRVTKMDDHLHASKKKLNEVKTGRPSIK